MKKKVYEVYVPRRDYRFEYAADAIGFVESNFCAKGCKFSSGDIDFPSLGCHTELENLMFEQTVPTILDADENGLICTEYEGYNDGV